MGEQFAFYNWLINRPFILVMIRIGWLESASVHGWNCSVCRIVWREEQVLAKLI